MEKKSSETSKSILKSVLYSLSTWLLPLGLSFIATPIIVKSLGNEDYGIYALVLGFIGYSFNLNTGRAITKYIAEYRVTGETDKINDVISATLLINTVIGLFGAVLIGFLANWLISDIFLIEPESQAKTLRAFYISSAIIFVTMLNQVFNAVLQGIQRFDIYSKIFNANSFGILIGNIILAIYGFGLNALLIWNLVVLVLVGVTVAIFSKKLLPSFKFTFKVKRNVFSQILGFSAGVFGYQILSNFLLLFERGWVIRKLGDENLTFYVVPMILGIYIHSFIASLLMVIFPLASELENDKKKLKSLYLKSTKIVCFLVIFICLTLIIQSKLFLSLWMGAEFADKSWQLLIVHTFTFGLLALLIVTWQIAEGLGYPIYNCIVFSICLVISVFLMIYLTNDYGSLGIATGRMLGCVLLFFSIFYVEKWFFKNVQIKFWLKMTGMIGIASIFAGVIEKLLIENMSLSWFTFIFSTLCGGLIYCIVLYLIGFITDEDKLLVKNILRR